MRRGNFFSKIIFPRLLIVALFLLLIFLILATSETTKRRYKIIKEVNSLKKEITNLDRQKNEFTQMIEYLNTLSFKEKEARLKLGLQKEGEKTIIVTTPYSDFRNEEETKEEKKEPPFFNFFRWWKYFFSKNN